MNVKPLLIANGVLIAAMAGVSFWLWPSIPADAQLPVHWNIEGHADRFGSKSEALLLLPAMAFVLTLVFVFLPRFDPRRKNLEASSKMWNAAAIGVVALLAYVHVFLALSAMGRVVDAADYIVPGLAVLFIVLGNYLAKTRSNWFAGVRTPWTLSSEYSWSKTHRLASRLFIGTGLVSILAWLIVGGKIASLVLFGALLATTVISIVASYFYWKSDPARASGAANGEA